MKQMPRCGYLFGLAMGGFSVTRDDDEQGKGFFDLHAKARE